METKKTIIKKNPAPRVPHNASVPTVTKKAEAKTQTPNVSEVAIYSMAGKKVGTIALPEKLFAAPWRADLVHQVITAQQANLRQNRAHTKDRSEVSGGGKKPWKQKGTGQARHGSTRSPIWRHGGVTFGPRNERDYSEKINRKMRSAALAATLSRKAKDGGLILVDSFSFKTPKTSEANAALLAISSCANAHQMMNKKKNAALLALASHDLNTVKSFRNIGNIATVEARNINPLDVMTYKYLIIEKPGETFAMLGARIDSK